MIPDAPRIVNDVSCLMKISHENRFSWQAQNLESLVVPHGANDVSYATRINHDGNDSWDTLLVCYAIQCFRMGRVTFFLFFLHFLPKIASNSPMSRDLHKPVPPKLSLGITFWLASRNTCFDTYWVWHDGPLRSARQVATSRFRSQALLSTMVLLLRRAAATAPTTRWFTTAASSASTMTTRLAKWIKVSDAQLPDVSLVAMLAV